MLLFLVKIKFDTVRRLDCTVHPIIRSFGDFMDETVKIVIDIFCDIACFGSELRD